ncbi:MAG: fibronectin type III domain-containing protein [Patescibacteria group bacterium]
MKKTFTILAVLVAMIFSISQGLRANAASYTLQQVQAHNTSTNCWVIVNNKVYNLTNYITQHPGGAAAITSLCGTNGTAAFSGQHSGNATANAQLNNYFLGNLTTADTTKPSAPSNLTANVISSAKINLTWSAATDNVAVTGYTIFRNGTEIASTATTTFSNIGLTASTTYTYTVKAYDAAGNKSANSNSISATTLTTSTDITSPSAPTNLTANPISTSQINLTWATSTDNVAVTGYSIFRNGAEIATVTSNTFNNLGLTASTTYSYTVKAHDGAGNMSANSNIASATTLKNSGDNTAPNAPRKLKAHVVSYTHVNLKWKAPERKKGIKGYAIFRDGIKIATVKRNHFNDIGLNPATTYTYTVRAYDKAGNMSSDSNIISITTLTRKANNDHDDEDDEDEDDEDDHYDRHDKKDNILSKIEKIKIKKQSKKDD